MKIKLSFWEISLNGNVLNYTFTYKQARKWVNKWMEENLLKQHKVLDQDLDRMVDSGEYIYNGFDKIKIRECIINDERKSPAMVVSVSYYNTND